MVLSFIACGPTLTSDPGVTAASVHHSSLTAGLRIGMDGTPFVTERCRGGNQLGEAYLSGRALTLGPLTSPNLSVILRPSDQVVVQIAWGVASPGAQGKQDCDAVYQALVVEYGPPNSWSDGLWMYPEARWHGTDLLVRWGRTGELGTDHYNCGVTWTFEPAPR